MRWRKDKNNNENARNFCECSTINIAIPVLQFNNHIMIHLFYISHHYIWDTIHECKWGKKYKMHEQNYNSLKKYRFFFLNQIKRMNLFQKIFPWKKLLFNINDDGLARRRHSSSAYIQWSRSRRQTATINLLFFCMFYKKLFHL